MLNHNIIWEGIDALAARHGLSPSGLARLAGLDPTAFNRSKRVGKDGRERWPSTESIAKILQATEEGFDSFLHGGGAYVQMSAERTMATVPLIGIARAGSGGFFDNEGFPAGEGWDLVRLPSSGDDGTYALEVSGDSMLPVYRDRDIIVVSPAVEVRPGDRVVLRTREGEVLAKHLYRRTPKQIELHSLNPEHPNRTFQTNEVEWIARIIWASQ